MKVSLICALTSSCLLLTLNQGSLGQSKTTRTTASVAAENSDREQDGLNGPVRRVRVETAKVTVKDGQLVEGPRVLSEIATYDPRGQKIDSVAYPVEASTLPGKQEYRYDDQGNIVEMTLRGADGSTLSKETYKYEMDELGNWNKMTSSVAIFENGKISYEPIEVTYRTIAYYYGQAVDKLGAAAKLEARSQIKPKTPASVTPKTSVKETAEASRVSTTGSSVASSNGAVTEPRIIDQANNEVNEEASATPRTEEPSKPQAQISSAANNTGGLTVPEKSPSAPPTSVSVKRITETELRSAAVYLPEPEHSGTAGVPNGKVEVQVIIGDGGEVLNARAMSGHPLLIDSAEAAARKASFSRTKLTSDSGQLFGTITYDFKAPEPKVTLLSTSAAAATENSKRVDPPANSVPTKPIPAASISTSNAAPPAERSRENSAGSNYDKGLAFLSTGKYPEAVEALKQSVRLNPNDAKSYLKLGLAYSVQGQNKETVAALKMAIQIKPEAVDAQGYYHLGHASAGLGKHKDALEAFKQALYTRRAEAVDGSKPQNAPPVDQLHLGIGTMHYNLRRHYEAIEELRKAIELNPKLAEAYYVMCLAYLAVGNRTAAANLHRTLQTLDAQLAKQIGAALTNPDLLLPCRNVYGLCR
jgi:YD repeat-containing protein